MNSCITVKEISAMLAERAEQVCEHYLPNGRREGSEWRCGDTSGDAGHSLGVHLSGEKAGVWKDFAGGEGGDLIDLIMQVQGCNTAAAINEAEDFLGIREEAPHFAKAKKREFKVPARPRGMTNVDGELMAWFGSRGISSKTVQAFKVGMIVKNGAPVMVFPYMFDGKLAFEKFRPMLDKKGMWTSADSRPCLFGWQAFPENSRQVVIVEGELDAMALHEAGVAALSVPRGGGDGDKQDTWIDEEWDHLKVFDTVFLALDMDETGRKAAEQIADRLGKFRCRFVDFGQYKDANEALLAGVDLSPSASIWADAKTVDPEELRSATDYESAIKDYLSDVHCTRGESLPWPKTEGQVGLRPGEMTIWAGINGHGKSQLVGFVAVDSMYKGHRWCIASMEFKPHKLLARICRQITACSQPQEEPGLFNNAMGFMENRLWMYDVQGTAKTDSLLEVFEYAFRRYGVDNFLIDSLAKCGLAEDDYNGQKKLVDQLSDFARNHGVCVHLVCHSRKGMAETDMPDKLDIKGSGSITDMVDNVFIVWRNKPKEDARQQGKESKKDEPDCIVNCCKQREGEWEGKIKLWFDRASLQYIESPNIGPARYC